MSFFRQLEEIAARKLKKVFLGAQKYADSSIEDLDKARKTLQLAKERAADATTRAHQAAVEAAEKAQTVADQLMLEAKAAESRAREYREILEKTKGEQ